MLFFFPHRHEDRSSVKSVFELIDGERAGIKVRAQSAVTVRRVRKGLTLYTAVMADQTGYINAVWFNNKFVAIKPGEEYTLFGQISAGYGKKEILSPVYEKAGQERHTAKIIPIYPLTAGLSQKMVSNAVSHSINLHLGGVGETLPPWVRKKEGLADIRFSIQNMHFPADFKSYDIARRRFVFEEFFMLQIGLRSLKQRRKNQSAAPLSGDFERELVSKLSFSLTRAQERVLKEIKGDLGGKTPMNRLVQGDVGSGKTVIAAAAMYIAAKNGYQAALMAPTEILAAQHYETLAALFKESGPEIRLITGGAGKEKQAALYDLAHGRVPLAVGTHALLEKGVEFKNLALAITDEQHRFGVRQRGALSDKAQGVHVLVMSATPIPRTLALILYGDLDISVIDELPPGRQAVDTFVISEKLRDRAYAFVRGELQKGRQAYIICPLVEENDELSLKSVTAHAEKLKESVLRGYNTEFLHGKMSRRKKDEIMADFLSGETKALVSTTVVEVGVNVPNASIMIVENAERFGLSQLHQLRGRVGRGAHKSYCILISDARGDITRERLDILTKTADGFEIADKDLKLRGAGEFFGTRQHGLPELKVANILEDKELLYRAGAAAEKLLKEDARLKNEEHKALRKRIEEMFSQGGVFN